MASYTPPTAILPTFDPIVFRQITDGLTIEDGDLRYLRFPTGQGAEYIPSLSVGGLTTLAGATYNAGTSPAYEIKYPVNSGRFDFYANTAGGVSTRGCKIDATGVHTISKFDTIDETAGTLDIGTLAARTGDINIGTGTGANKSIILGNQGTTSASLCRLRAFNIELNPAITNGTLNLATFNTGGSITMGGTVGGSTTIAIGNGTGQTGAISIGTGNTASAIAIVIGNQTGSFGTVDIGTTTITVGKGNTANNNIQTATGGTLNLKTTSTGGNVNIGTGMTSGTITIGGSGTNTITINRPLLPAYTGTTPALTEIGYKADIAGLVLAANYPTATGNITTSSFSIPNGVWLVNMVVKVNFATALAGSVFLRLSLSTASATLQDARTIDFNPNDDGNNFLNYTTTIAIATATNYFLVGASGGTPNPTIVSTVVNITRIA
tara:strand:+ start:58 stop:1368 length:1311 start_codon:yes stop_codon:yes gene_type:complete